MPTDLRLWPRLFLAIVVAIATLPLGAMAAFADHVEPADEMFFYRASDGLFRYYDVSSDGRIGSPVLAGDGYTRGWSSVSAVDLDGDGQDEMFFCRASDGLFRYYDVSSDGRIGSPVLAGDGYTRGWTSITAVDLDEVRCVENPFTASRVSALEARYAGQSFTAYAYDTRSGCEYTMNPISAPPPSSR